MDKKTCNVPGCNKKGKYRGLCPTHYSRSLKGDPEAIGHRNPSKTTGSRSAPKPAGEKTTTDQAADADEKRARGLPQRIDQAQARKSQEADERITAVTEFATAMGIDHIDYNGGRLYPCPKTGSFIFLTDGGNIQEAVLSLGTAQ